MNNHKILKLLLYRRKQLDNFIKFFAVEVCCSQIELTKRTTKKIYTMDIVQDKLKDLPENLNREEVKEFYENYKRKKSREQEKRERLVKKPIEVPSHIREGKRIRGYSRTKGHRYSEIQENFLKSKVEVPVKTLADQFNNAFGTKLTSVGIRDKRLRLLGQKR